MSFWKNLVDVLEIAGTAVVLNKVNDWLNQKVIELRHESTQMRAMVDIAQFVGSLNDDEWNTFIAGVRLKSIGNEEVTRIKNLCELVVQIELNEFRQLLNMNMSDAQNILFNIIERNPVERCIYIGLLLSRSRDVKASHLLNSIIDTAHRHEPVPRKVASGQIHKLWVEHNIRQNNEKGMYIHIDLEIENSIYEKCSVIAWFYYSDGRRLEDVNGRYHTSDGQVCTWKDFEPPYEVSRYRDLQMFMPYSEFDIYKAGNYNLKFCVGLFNGHDKLDTSDYVFIEYNLG